MFRRTLLLPTIAALVALVGLSFVVTRSSQAVFSAQTDNTGNFVNTYAIDLTDDDAATAMFEVDGMVEGQTEWRCIAVTYSDGSPDDSNDGVKLYFGNLTETGGTLGTALDLTVERGDLATHTYGASAACDGGLDAVDNTLVTAAALDATVAANTDYASGLGTWVPTNGQTKIYRVGLTLPGSSGVNPGDSVDTLSLTWEVQKS